MSEQQCNHEWVVFDEDKLCCGNCPAESSIADLQSQITQLQAENEVFRNALNKLARLGNEPHYGNSKGNEIAIAALRAAALRPTKVFCAMLSTGVCDLPEKIKALDFADLANKADAAINEARAAGYLPESKE